MLIVIMYRNPNPNPTPRSVFKSWFCSTSDSRQVTETH